MMLRKMLIAAALTALAVPVVAAQEAGDFTARLNRPPGQAAPAPDPEFAPEQAPAASSSASPLDDLTARLNRARGAARAPQPTPDDTAPEVEAPSGPPILEGLSERLEQMRQAPADALEPHPAPVPASEPEPEPQLEPAPPEPDVEPETAVEAEAEAVPQPEPSVRTGPLTSQAGLAFRVEVPEGFDLVERPSGPDFDVYQVSRGGTPFVGIYVGCCSPFPIYDGRQVETGNRRSILINEDGSNRAVEHLFVRETDGRQIHVWLHSVTGPDRAIAERIAQTVDPR